MSAVTKLAKQIGLDTEKLLGDWIACIPGFTLQKYRQLQRSQLSIFSVNCFGGSLSHTLGLPFRSPFVNLFLTGQDFIKFLQHPRIYIEDTPVFEKMDGFSPNYPNGYPVFNLGNISLNMMHYTKVDEALKKWNGRKQRINWNNILVICNTEDRNILEQFDALTYGKKICIVSFKSDLYSAFYVDKKIRSDLKEWWRILDGFSRGDPFYYDPFDMLLYGKKTPLIKM